jgi:hypothetical protein
LIDIEAAGPYTCYRTGPRTIRCRGSSDCRVLIVSHKPTMIDAAAPAWSPI